MKRGQGVLPLELLDNMFGEVYDMLHLRVLWHLHESQGCFCHCGDRSSEDWICNVVELIVEIAWGETESASRPLMGFGELNGKHD